LTCDLDEAAPKSGAATQHGANLMRAAIQEMHLSARAYHRALKLARTIADLAGDGEIGVAHLAEAIQYRPRMAV
jgi:magnesium chelatase family protein